MERADLAALLHGWLSARSIARDLPAPVADHGGYRVDTNDIAEIKRWVFAAVCPGLIELGQAIDAPGYVLKACIDGADMRAALPDRWRLHPPTYFMEVAGSSADHALPPGYELETFRTGAVTAVRIRTREAALAASGFGAETGDAFVYDRIETAAAHRRMGLGRAVMAALDRARRDRNIPALLVATEEGRALYTTLGWRVIAPYSTASIDA